MKTYLQLAFKNEEGDRTSIRFNEFDHQLDGEKTKLAMDQILASEVLMGKNGLFTLKNGAKIVTIEEQDLVPQG
ncbi:MAG: DUF2922 domain-containing protein [Tissierellia bacterium]|nr:DUF2922 domain-containing protein [Tissierellia bacterium]